MLRSENSLDDGVVRVGPRTSLVIRWVKFRALRHLAARRQLPNVWRRLLISRENRRPTRAGRFERLVGRLTRGRIADPFGDLTRRRESRSAAASKHSANAATPSENSHQERWVPMSPITRIEDRSPVLPPLDAV